MEDGGECQLLNQQSASEQLTCCHARNDALPTLTASWRSCSRRPARSPPPWATLCCGCLARNRCATPPMWGSAAAPTRQRAQRPEKPPSEHRQQARQPHVPPPTSLPDGRHRLPQQGRAQPPLAERATTGTPAVMRQAALARRMQEAEPLAGHGAAAAAGPEPAPTFPPAKHTAIPLNTRAQFDLTMGMQCTAETAAMLYACAGDKSPKY